MMDRIKDIIIKWAVVTKEQQMSNVSGGSVPKVILLNTCAAARTFVNAIFVRKVSAPNSS
jgi:hypothetical protein